MQRSNCGVRKSEVRVATTLFRTPGNLSSRSAFPDRRGRREPARAVRVGGVQGEIEVSLRPEVWGYPLITQHDVVPREVRLVGLEDPLGFDERHLEDLQPGQAGTVEASLHECFFRAEPLVGVPFEVHQARDSRLLGGLHAVQPAHGRSLGNRLIQALDPVRVDAGIAAQNVERFGSVAEDPGDQRPIRLADGREGGGLRQNVLARRGREGDPNGLVAPQLLLDAFDRIGGDGPVWYEIDGAPLDHRLELPPGDVGVEPAARDALRELLPLRLEH